MLSILRARIGPSPHWATGSKQRVMLNATTRGRHSAPAVVELYTITQMEGPRQTVLIDFPILGKSWLNATYSAISRTESYITKQDLGIDRSSLCDRGQLLVPKRGQRDSHRIFGLDATLVDIFHCCCCPRRPASTMTAATPRASARTRTRLLRDSILDAPSFGAGARAQSAPDRLYNNVNRAQGRQRSAFRLRQNDSSHIFGCDTIMLVVRGVWV